MKYSIGAKTFKTKKESYEYTKKLISNIGCGTIKKDHKEYDFFVSLLDNHNERNEKIGLGIDYFFITPNSTNKGAFQTMIKRIDGSEIDFSWVNCSRFLKTQSKESNLNKAMRDAISPYTIEYKKNNLLKCGLCGLENEPYNSFHVDHIEPFSNIRDKFLLDYKKENIPLVFKDNPFNNTAMFADSDEQFKNDWVSFHNSVCDYQILCEKCNRKKSNS
jgi:hypothetical protein